MPAILFLFGLFLYIYCEISLLVSVGSAIGVLPLILLMIAISAFGLWVVKLRGLFTLASIRQQIAQGKVPTDAVINSIIYAFAGILLLIPGFLSNILAILLLLPFSRLFIKGALAKVFADKIRVRRFGSFEGAQQTFDTEFERKHDEDKWLK